MGKSIRTAPQHKKRKRKTRQKVILALWLYFGIVGMITTCWILWSLILGGVKKVQAAGAMLAERIDGPFEEDEDASEVIDRITEETFSDDNGMPQVTEEKRQECQMIYNNQPELLVLVNKQRELSPEYQPGLQNICKGRLQAAQCLYEDLTDLLRDAGAEGYEYWIASAYRSREYQQGLVDDDVLKYRAMGYSNEEALEKTYLYTMPAGKSEHETGLALDILCSGNMNMDESQENEPGNRWLQQHCWEYGFILRYPKDKEEVTEIEYEPWHLRYVGKEAAKFLKENDWTLEEYYWVLEGGL